MNPFNCSEVIYKIRFLIICTIRIVSFLTFVIGGEKSTTFTTYNSEEESKIIFYFLLRHCNFDNFICIYKKVLM